MMSLHSWIGLSVVIAFVLQVVYFHFPYCSALFQYAVGFITFFAPGLSIPMREMIMPFHQFFGLVIFICVSVAVALGISERAAWKHTLVLTISLGAFMFRCWTKEREMCGQHAVSNFVGVFTFGYIFCVAVSWV